MIKRYIALLFLVFLLLNIGCEKEETITPDENNPNDTSYRYFGLTPPGNTAVRFGTVNIQSNTEWFWHGSLAFTPDLRTMYMDVYYPDDQFSIQLKKKKYESGSWSEIQLLSFSGNYSLASMSLTSDGNRMYFMSDQMPGSINCPFWYVEKNGNSWGNPHPLNIDIPNNLGFGWKLSVANSGNIYAHLFTENGASSNIYKITFEENQYTAPINLDNVNSGYGGINAFIDQDEQFIIFSSMRPEGYGGADLYISFRDGNDNWSNAINLGPNVNSDDHEGSPYISPDKRYLFFTSSRDGNRDPYWIDASFIDELNPYTKGEVTDYEGNIYKTVKIGDQWWMAENLKSKHTWDGTLVSGVYIYNNSESNADIYGRLYNWEAAKSNFIEGWHLPNDEEWNTLEETLGSDVAAKLKEGGSSGFEAKLVGFRNYDGGYAGANLWTVFWTSSPIEDDHAFVRNLFSDNNDFVHSGCGNIGANSVRLIKD